MPILGNLTEGFAGLSKYKFYLSENPSVTAYAVTPPLQGRQGAIYTISPWEMVMVFPNLVKRPGSQQVMNT